MQTKQLFLIIFFFIIEHNYCQINSLESDLIDYNFYSDTIKNRLARLDAKTPLELYFTPEVEKRIKRHLKTRVDFYNDNIEKINYYLPLYE